MHGFTQWYWLALHQGHRRPMLVLLVKPGLGQMASAFAAADAAVLDGDSQIIADTSTNGAGNMIKRLHSSGPWQILAVQG